MMTSDPSKLNRPLDASLIAARPRPSWALLKFFLLTYAVMWTCFFSVAAMSARTPGRGLLLFLGPFAPSLAALWLTARADGNQGVRALLRRVLQWRVGARWYLFAISYIAAIKLAVALLHRAITGSWPHFGHELPGVILVAIVISTPFQAGEEVGWRGYALPRLVARFGLARASILLGLIWACWHLPQFFVREADTYGQSFSVYVLQVTALSVAIAWLWARTNGSLLLPMLMHAAVNNSKDIVPSATLGATNTFSLNASLAAWLTVTLLWICAAYFLIRMSKREHGKGAVTNLHSDTTVA
jgi:membrane protease YdiL (CAAX protease family)